MREVGVDFREDDGIGARASALARLVLGHPARCARDVLGHRRGEPSLFALAPAVLRLRHDPGAHVQALGGGEAEATARRLAALAGGRYEPGVP
jgi:hypothetical protein